MFGRVVLVFLEKVDSEIKFGLHMTYYRKLHKEILYTSTPEDRLLSTKPAFGIFIILLE